MVQPSSKEKGKRVEANPDAINVDDNDSVESGEAPDIAINDKAEKDASHDAKGTKRPREVDEYGDNGCSSSRGENEVGPPSPYVGPSTSQRQRLLYPYPLQSVMTKLPMKFLANEDNDPFRVANQAGIQLNKYLDALYQAVYPDEYYHGYQSFKNQTVHEKLQYIQKAGNILPSRLSDYLDFLRDERNKVDHQEGYADTRFDKVDFQECYNYGIGWLDDIVVKMATQNY